MTDELKDEILAAENDEEIEQILETAWREARTQSLDLSTAYTLFKAGGPENFSVDDVIELLDRPVKEEDLEKGTHK